MNREVRAIPDVMITSTAPALAFLLYFCRWCHITNNLNGSVVTGKSQTSAYRTDLAIARSIQQGLSLRFSCNDLTLGY